MQATSRFKILFRKYGSAYLLIAPFFILFFIFGIYPLFYALLLSFQNWKPGGATVFNGIDNYVRLFNDSVFWETTLNTIYLLIINVPLLVGFAVIFAALFSDKAIRFREGFQLIFLLPYVTSSVAVSLVFLSMLEDGGGFINTALISIGLDPVPWLHSKEFSMISVNILILWQWTGYNMLLILGGMQNIPTELFEAAYIDGGGKLRSFFSITLPLLRPVILFATIMATIGTFNTFVQPNILTMGGPGYSSTTLTLYMYKMTFANFQLGYGATISVAILIFTLIFSIPQIRSSVRYDI